MDQDGTVTRVADGLLDPLGARNAFYFYIFLVVHTRSLIEWIYAALVDVILG